MTHALADLGRHLADRDGIKVTRTTALEPWAPDGVQRVDLDRGESWVARPHGPARPIADVHGDAELLRFLEDHDFPAARLAPAEPVSTYWRRRQRYWRRRQRRERSRSSMSISTTRCTRPSSTAG